MQSTWTHKYEGGRTTREGYLRVTAGLHYIKGNHAPYFSVTGERWQSHGWWKNGQDRRMLACGQLHDEILRAFPWLAPVVALHLSDDAGMPMHAEANGRYWIEQGEPEKAAKLWRCSVDDLPKIEDVPAFVDAQRDRWQAEADAAIVLLDSKTLVTA